ncbi:MAG: hypothetical protein DHS20C16_05460 [Phycisphaerae bacterium]|nr:MAG: hypothetical protein DHS20C16_05460 [Phycisphaerae bacterium]
MHSQRQSSIIRFDFRIVSLLLGVGLCAAFVGCEVPPTPDPTCTADSDCADGEQCVNGECVADSGCTSDDDCGDGEQCVDGECVAASACTSDDDCAEGEECTDGECVPAEQPQFANQTDRSNNDADYVGSTTCAGCHPGVAEQQAIHSHSHKLTKIEGGPPTFPEEGTRAGIPDPPDGFTWDDISYVIGGYYKKGRFIDTNGFILITGLLDIPTQWNLDFPPNGNVAGFVDYEGSRETPKPYGHSCFQCHTTGPLPLDEDFPEFQDGLPGLEGTWEEPGIQCESCHGPGSNHVADVSARDLYVDPGSTTCAECHNRPFNAQDKVILASNGYIKHHEQYPELLASGGHSAFNCGDCHDPHISTAYDRENAIKQACTDCHANVNMASHEGVTFIRGEYQEVMSCESCHMPYATRSGSNATEAVSGPDGRIGDTKTHIFRINTAAEDFASFFNEDGSEVVRDDQGQAAVTLDFVCLRCHNGIGNAFSLTVGGASGVASDMHSE